MPVSQVSSIVLVTSSGESNRFSGTSTPVVNEAVSVKPTETHVRMSLATRAVVAEQSVPPPLSCQTSNWLGAVRPPRTILATAPSGSSQSAALKPH